MMSVTLYTTVLMAVSLVSAAAVGSRDAGLAMYAQCGGQNWTGSTVCAAPAVCVAQSQWYSQCLASTGSATPVATSTAILQATSLPPVTSSKPAPTSTVVKTSTVTAVPSSTPTASAGSLPFLMGVNMAGFDFGMDTNGYSGSPVAPPTAQFAHFASEGVNIFRMPFGWQYMQPTLGGALSTSFFAQYDAEVQTALNTGAYVIVDLHNYARWNGAIIGQGGPTNAQFADFWSKFAAKYATQPRVMFGVMNEPHDVNVAEWVASVQAAVNAIRQAGATSNYILLPGSTWAHASALPTEAGPALAKVTNPAGGTAGLIFDIHQYLDSDGSGQSTTCTTNNVDVMTATYSWLKSVGNRQALLSETGGGNTASCETAVAAELAYLKAHSDLLVGFTIWSAGAFDSSYALSVVPNGNTDTALWTAAVKPLLSA